MTKCYRTGKTRYPDALEANIQINRIRKNITRHRKQRFREEPKRAYECEFCLGWHITSQAKGERDLGT